MEGKEDKIMKEGKGTRGKWRRIRKDGGGKYEKRGFGEGGFGKQREEEKRREGKGTKVKWRKKSSLKSERTEKGSINKRLWSRWRIW